MHRIWLSAVAFVAVAPAPLRATWYSENVENGADIVMMDLRWPWWPSGSYFANWNTGFNPKPNNLSFYAGFTSYLADGPGQTPNPDTARQDGFRPGSVWTFWGSDAGGTPVRFTDVAPNLFIKNDYGGEGSSGTTGAEVWPFVQRGRWYTMLARVWQPVDGGGHAFVARWIKDHADGTWHLIGVAELPVAATSFTGNSGFLEPLGSEKAVRSLHRRLGYFRKDDTWKKSDTISIDKTQYVVVNTVPEGDHEYAAIEYAQSPDNLPRELKGEPISGDEKHRFVTKQPDRPTLGHPAVENVRAVASGGHVAVSWDVPPTATPGFSFKVELFDNPAATGSPVASREVRMPTLRTMLLAAPGGATTVRLTSTDVFDQPAEPVIAHAAMVKVGAPPPLEGKTRPGLAYELLHKDTTRQINYFTPALQKPDERHTWLTLDELPQGTLVRRGLARGFDTGVRGSRDHGYGLTFSGYLHVAAAGPHIFHAQIDGAYRLELDGQDALVWDGQHGTTEKSAVLVLAAGDHPLKLTHLYDALAARNFGISWEGPGLARQPIPVEALRIVDDGAFPVATVKADAPGDGTGIVSVITDTRGHTVNKTALFLGALQLAEAAGATVEYRGPLPAGVNTFWARVTYDGNRTVDADPQSLTVGGPPVSSDWTLRNVGDAKASAGVWQTGDGQFQFFGNGMHTVTRRLTGDFTATCRLVNYNGAHGEPVNPRAWTGLTAREHGERINWEWGTDFHLVQTARDGLRASADFTDFGAGRTTSYPLPEGRPWLRIVRQGNVWTAWTSTNGHDWQPGAYQFKKATESLDVGLFFSALPQEARAHYHSTVSDFSIVSGAATDCRVPEPVAARNTDGARLTGVVMARSDAKVIVVRSSHAGLMRSADGGLTWAPANGPLTGDDLAVRSVAIHPENPAVMLRATGRGRNGHLWKTSDAGKTWTLLPLEADFDGVGPSALCGEVVAFDLRDPQVVYAGSESHGFFKSADGGVSWTCLGVTGERITSVVVWPWEKHYPAPAKGRTHLCVTTSPDRWMPLLGRGNPAVSTKTTSSKAWISRDGVQTLVSTDERADTGFFNVAFDKAMQSVNEMRYATSHGYQTQVFEGRHMALYPPEKNLEWLRPFTAVAATARGEEKFGRFIAQALDPARPGRYSVSERWAFEWSWLTPTGDVPQTGLIAAAGDVHLGKAWCFLHTDGIYISTDGGVTLKRMLAKDGSPVRNSARSQ